MAVPSQVLAQEKAAEERFLKDQGTPPATETPTDKPLPAKTEDQQIIAPDDSETWKHKFEVLQGKYNSEIKAIKDDVELLNTMKAQNRQYATTIADLNTRLIAAEERLRHPEQPVVAPKDTVHDSVIDFKKYISDEDSEHFEAEGFDDGTIERIGQMALKIAREAASQEVNPVRNEFAQIKKAKQEDSWTSFTKGLSDNVPNYLEIDAMESWKSWLREPVPDNPPYYVNRDGRIRNDVLVENRDSGDYKTVASMFNEFAKSANVKITSKIKPIDPEDLIEPDTTRGDRVTTGSGEVVTLSEMKQFYKDVATGKFKGREQESVKIEAEMLQAQLEGRFDRSR